MKSAEGQAMQTEGIVGTKIEGIRRGRSNVKDIRRSILLTVALTSTGLLAGCSGLISGAKTAIQEAFQLNPTSVSFGKVGVGKQATQSISISNTGTTAVSITQATFSNSQFSLPGATFPMSMATGQSSNLTVAVTPTSSGTITGTLTVLGSDGSSSATLNLSATAVTPGAQISLNSTTVQFGTVSVGSTGNANLTISNTGGSDLTISVIAITGAEFGATGIATPKTISAGQSVPVALTFKPTTAGAVTGSLTITSNDPTNPTTTVTLDGTGSTSAVGQLQDAPSSLSFGNISVGSSGTKQITLSNTGNAAVQITSIAATGTGFTVNGISVPYTLNPSATAILNVVFAPTTGGSVSSTITVISDANGSPLKISVSGTGVQAGLSVTPSSFAYGSVVDGQTKSQTFTLTNTGNSSLTISQLGISGSGYSVSGLTTPASLAAGASTTFSAVFAPTTAGGLSGTVTVSSNAPNSPATVALSGTGVASTVTLSANPTGLSFGNVTAGTSSTKTVTLTNSGNSSLTISQVTVSAKDVTESGMALPVTLAAGKTQTMNVKFSPTAAETVSGNITVTNSQGSSTVVTVSGTGLQAGISLTPSSANFGNVVVGAANSQTIQVSNPGNATLTITQASVTGTGFSTNGLSLPLSINPGQSATFNAQFQPSSTGSASGGISIVSNAAGSPSGVSLSGTGITATETLSLSTTSVNFGNVDTGVSSTQTETVTNTGNSNVQISQISISGTGFSLSGASVPVTLSPSQKLTFSVIFNPTTAGSVTGGVTITSNAAGSPATVALSGSGVAATPHSVSLSWTASTSTVSGYNVYRSTTSGAGYSKVNGGLVGGVNYTDSSVQNGVTYYYVTTAVDSSGNESRYSNEASANIP
jgi:Abnormal spindle-like microcephaly-assoc'd, ASPM-SPD-2-Hydin/Protein of unknown function (DUF1573)